MEPEQRRDSAGALSGVRLELSVRMVSSALSRSPVERLQGDVLALDTRREMASIEQELAAGLRLASSPIDARLGFNDIAVFESIGPAGNRYVFKPMPDVVAAKVHFVSALANLLGVRTTLVVAARVSSAAGGPAASGTLQRFLENYDSGRRPDTGAFGPTALNYLVTTRWFNEIIGNLHCWWGQLLLRTSDAARLDDAVMIDFDDAFSSVSPQFLHRALIDYFGVTGVDTDDCRWLDREFDIDAPIAWAPSNYDSPYAIYGELWRDFLTGRIDLDLAAGSRAAERAQTIPAQVVDLAMDDFIQASEQLFRQPWVFLPAAANPKFHADAFRERFHLRLRRSTAQFVALLNSIDAARDMADSPIARFYANAAPRKY